MSNVFSFDVVLHFYPRRLGSEPAPLSHPIRSKTKTNPNSLVLIGSLDCLFSLLWAKVMTLVVVLRHSIKTAVSCFKPTCKNILSSFCHLLDFTRDPEGGKQAHDKDNCSSVMTILTSLVAVLSVALLILGACFLSWRKKQRKGDLLSYLYNMSAGCY